MYNNRILQYLTRKGTLSKLSHNSDLSLLSFSCCQNIFFRTFFSEIKPEFCFLKHIKSFICFSHCFSVSFFFLFSKCFFGMFYFIAKQVYTNTHAHEVYFGPNQLSMMELEILLINFISLYCFKKTPSKAKQKRNLVQHCIKLFLKQYHMILCNLLCKVTNFCQNLNRELEFSLVVYLRSIDRMLFCHKLFHFF